MISRLLLIMGSVLIFSVTLLGLLLSLDTLKRPDGPTKHYQMLNNGHDFNVHLHLARHAVERARMEVNGKTIYDVTYEFDQNYLRKLPLKNPDLARRHMIFAGCSFVHGEGLEARDTFPWKLEQRVDEWNVYNLAQKGGSLARTLKYMEMINLRDFIREEEGDFFYVFISDHLERWHAYPPHLAWTYGMAPYYETRNGRVEYVGPFQDQFFYQAYMFLKVLGLEYSYLRLNRYLRPKFSYDDEELEAFVTGVKELRDRYHKLYPLGKFHFFFYPASPYEYPYYTRLKEMLEKEGIVYHAPFEDLIEFRKKIDQDHFRLFIPHDGHPGPVFNDFVVEWIQTKFSK